MRVPVSPTGTLCTSHGKPSEKSDPIKATSGRGTSRVRRHSSVLSLVRLTSGSVGRVSRGPVAGTTRLGLTSSLLKIRFWGGMVTPVPPVSVGDPGVTASFLTAGMSLDTVGGNSKIGPSAVIAPLVASASAPSAPNRLKRRIVQYKVTCLVDGPALRTLIDWLVI